MSNKVQINCNFKNLNTSNVLKSFWKRLDKKTKDLNNDKKKYSDFHKQTKSSSLSRIQMEQSNLLYQRITNSQNSIDNYHDSITHFSAKINESTC